MKTQKTKNVRKFKNLVNKKNLLNDYAYFKDKLTLDEQKKVLTEVEEIKAHKQAIGLVENPAPFPTHEIQLNEGDAFYIFSDGYVDQFGGEKGKKYKTPNFRKLLLSIQDKNMKEQHQLIDETFEQWRGALEQIDDVCVIGVRL